VVFETETTVFWHQMNGFLSLDNRQDLQLWPDVTWIAVITMTRAYLSAPTMLSIWCMQMENTGAYNRWTTLFDAK